MNEYKSTAKETTIQILRPITEASMLNAVIPGSGDFFLLGKTVNYLQNRYTHDGIRIKEQNGSDNINEEQIYEHPVFGTDLNAEEKRILFKDALALSQDIYVVNNHSKNFYHTETYNRDNSKGWYIIDDKLRGGEHPKEILDFRDLVIKISLNNKENGLGSAVFYTKQNHRLIIAYVTEGTNLGTQDLGADIEQGIKETPQYRQSMDNAKKIADLFKDKLGGVHKLYFFGHSLGGGLANANALHTGYPAITFNAAALNSDFAKKYSEEYKQNLMAGSYVKGEFLSKWYTKALGMRKDGDRYRTNLSWKDYTTKDLPCVWYLAPELRSHLLEPLCNHYGLKSEKCEFWNKSNNKI